MCHMLQSLGRQVIQSLVKQYLLQITVMLEAACKLLYQILLLWEAFSFGLLS